MDLARAPLDPSASLRTRLVPLWCLVGGSVLGALWGGLARLWMRAITTEHPEFTWAGTIFIVAAFALAGMMLGPVIGARRRHWEGGSMAALRVVGCTATLALCVGQGALMAPTLVLGGLALGRRHWPLWLRAVLAVLAVAPIVLVHLAVADGWPHSPWRLAGAVALALVVYGGAVVALAQAYAPAPGARLPSAARWGLLAAPAAVVTTIGVPNAIEAPAMRWAVAVTAAALVVMRVRGRARRADRSAPGIAAGEGVVPAATAGVAPSGR
jgi:hypothetical protein